MKYPFYSKTKEEIRRKLSELYWEPSAAYRKVLDFDRGYHFFSNNEPHMVKYSSRWFNPDKYDQPTLHEKLRAGQEDPTMNAFKVNYEDGSWKKGDPSWKLQRLGCPTNQQTRDLEKLGRTPYHIGMEGEKFRVVAATLQKCNSPFVRRTFQFTSNGIIETPVETRDDRDQMKVFPIITQTKKGLTQKLVTIRRFRVIKKDSIAGEKSLLPQKIKIGSGEKPRYLTVRIRSKDGESCAEKKRDLDPVPEVVRLTSSTEEEDFDYNEKVQSPSAQTEETDDGEEVVVKPKDDEPERDEKKDPDSNDTDEAPFDYEDFGKRFPYQVRSQQRQQCQFCDKRFISSKQMREHIRSQHPQRYTRSGGTTEDRIKTATSKFGRTRRVLNIAGLRSKYKML